MWVGAVELKPVGRKAADGGLARVELEARKAVAPGIGPRLFQDRTPRLPCDTPGALRDLRERELSILKGIGSHAIGGLRHLNGRMMEYALYDDLGTPGDPRRPLGLGDRHMGNGIGLRPPQPSEALPFPRRLWAGEHGEGGATAGEKWVPLDHEFDSVKADSFRRARDVHLGLMAVVHHVFQGRRALSRMEHKGGLGSAFGVIRRVHDDIATILSGKHPVTEGAFDGGEWDNFDQVMAVYDPQPGLEAAKASPELRPGSRVPNRTSKPGRLDAVHSGSALIRRVRDHVSSAVRFALPLVIKGEHTPRLPSDGPACAKPRPLLPSDAEFGRQYKAGCNPAVLAVPASLPVGCAISEDDVSGLLEGATMAELLGRQASDGGPARLMLVDYWEPFRSYAARINALGGRVQHAGRCLLYQRDNGHLVPVAIELWTPDEGSEDGPVRVFTPFNTDTQVWEAVKATFSSLDSAVHQLVSHYLRTHACTEPYIVATERCLAATHPLYQFLRPHYEHTLRMNAHARTTLVNAGGLLERTFTAGQYAMQLCAEAYRSWRFVDEALPADLIKRGIARRDADGKLQLLVQDYPYAEDALSLWSVIATYARKTLALYYPDDAAVAADPELRAWWTEIRTRGHPDADPAGWPVEDIATRAQLADIVTTIVWVCTGMHAAVNFSQYDYAGTVLNRSPMIRRRIPEQGTHAHKELASQYPETWQKAWLSHVTKPFQAVQWAGLMYVLSSHSPNEHYVSDKEHRYLNDPRAKLVFKAFLEGLKAHNKAIAKRNASSASVARSVKHGGQPYTALLTDSPPNVTGRGVPNSASV